MTTPVFLAVLCAALLQASWNTLVKIGEERFVGVALIAIFSGAVSLCGLAWVSLPNLSSLPWLLLSLVLHTGYCLFLSRAYGQGDLGQIYPLARGSAPLLAMMLSALFLREYPPLLGVIGALVLVSGVLLMALRGGGRRKLNGKAVRYALITAMFTAGYTLSDGAGARAAEAPLTYTLWLFTLNGIIMLPLLWLHQRGKTWGQIKRNWRVGLAGGTMSLLAYGIVIWALTQAPIGVVAALRESSVLFAMIFSVWLLKEPMGKARIAASLVIVTGVMLSRLG